MLMNLHEWGADIKVEGRSAVVRGVKRFAGCKCCCKRTARRRGAYCCGTWPQTVQRRLAGTEFIDRGYENIEKYLLECGAKIRRE